jgi:hypothetical protein
MLRLVMWIAAQVLLPAAALAPIQALTELPDAFNIVQVTPKGGSGEVLMGVHNIFPFITCATVGVIALAVGRSHFIAALMLSCIHLGAATAVVALHYRENHSRRRLPWRNLLQLTLPIAAVALALAAVLLMRHAVVFADIRLGKLAATTATPDTSCTAASVQFTQPAASCPMLP